MEKGYFQDASEHDFTSRSSSLDEGFIESKVADDWEVESADAVPLPTVVPPKLNLENLPTHILRSTAVDSLLQQNEDLMLRLKVQLRANAELEEEIHALRENSSSTLMAVDRLRDELLIYKEKDRLSALKYGSSHQEIAELKEKIKFLETQYAELYSTSKNRQHQLATKTKIISRHKKYRQALQRVAYGMRKNLVEAREESLRERELNKDLRTKLGEAAERIQHLSRQAQEDQKIMVETYETQIQSLHDSLNAANHEIAKLQAVRSQVEDLKDQQIEWENTKVRLERIIQSEREASQKQILELQEALISYRQECKEGALKIASLEEERDTHLISIAELKDEKQALSEQVESLQILWRDNQSRIEKMNSQIESLQKLNQHLSQQINTQRKENTDLKHMAENQSIEYDRRIRELNAHIKILQANSSSVTAE